MSAPTIRPKGHPPQARPCTVCHAEGCPAWAFVTSVLREGAWMWRMPDGWVWVAGEGGLCGAHAGGAEAREGTTPATRSSPTDAPTCPMCGDLMARTGKCHTCSTCGHDSGCS